MTITRRRLLQTAAAAAAASQLSPIRGAKAFRGGVAASSPPPTTGTTAQAAQMVASMNHRISASGFSTIFNPPWTAGSSGGDNPGAQYSSQDTLASGSFPTTMTLVQDGTVAGGVPTQSFGWVFRPGDIPAGHAPLFKVAGVTWDYSHGLQTYWPDGSLKWAAFSLMVPASFSPALNSSTTVAISDGGAGTWPAASGRALSEVYAQSLRVNGVAPTSAPPHQARTANMYALLNGDSNQYYAVKDLDGAAGARWTIKTKMQATTTANGTPDAQYVVTHRIWAMNNPSGALAGFRYFAEIRNPFYDDSTGTKLYQTFQPPNTGTPSAGINWQTVGPGGSGTVNHVPAFPYNTITFYNGAKSFTGQVSGSILTVSGASPPVGYLTDGIIVTGSWAGPGNPVVISGWTPDMTPIGPINFVNVYFILPDGNPYLITGGTFVNGNGGNGNYTLASYPAAPFGPSPVLYSSALTAPSGTVGLYDGATLTGQYSILYQLTVAGGDQPGQRGTYQLNTSVSSPVGPSAMTYWSSAASYTKPQINWYSGGKGGNMTPCIMTGADRPPIDPSRFQGGNNPCDGTAGSVAWAYFQPGTAYWLQLSTTAYIYPFANMVFTGPGIGTLTPVPALSSYSRYNMATLDGKYNFFQGTPSTGAITADTTLRVQINQTYWQSTGTFMPMDMSVNGAALPDTPSTFDWGPYATGSVRTQDIDVGGPPVEVGLMTNTAGWDFYKQTFATDKENRIFGMAPVNTACDFKSADSASFDRLLVMNGPFASGRLPHPYAGMPEPTYVRYQNGTHTASDYVYAPCAPGGGAPNNGNGYSNFPPPGTMGLYAEANPTHEPDLGTWAFMRFGELQYFDYMCEWAQMMNCSQLQNILNPFDPNLPFCLNIPDFPFDRYGGSVGGGQLRGVGWATRDIQKCAFWCSYDPTNNSNNPVFSDGSELSQYLIDHADDQAEIAYTQLNLADYGPGYWGSQAGADYVKASGMWTPMYGGHTRNMLQWQAAYTYGGMMFAALRGNTHARDFIAGWMNSLDRIGNNTILKGGSANAYIYHFGINSNNLGQTPGTIDNSSDSTNGIVIHFDEQYGGEAFYFQSNSTAKWVPNIDPPDMTTVVRNAFTTTIHIGGSGTPGNGDSFVAFATRYGTLPVVPNEIPSALTQSNVLYYVRDFTVTGGSLGNGDTATITFNLATSPGGPAIPITDTCTGAGIGILDDFYHYANPSIDNGVSNAFLCQVRNTVNWIHAAGSGQTTNPGHNANTFAGFT
jgi:hypothetical protein